MVEPPATIAHVFVADNNTDGVDTASGLGQKWLINDKHFESIAAIIAYFANNLLNGNVLLEHPISKFSRRSRREKVLSVRKGKEKETAGWQNQLYDDFGSDAGWPHSDLGTPSSTVARSISTAFSTVSDDNYDVRQLRHHFWTIYRHLSRILGANPPHNCPCAVVS